MKIKGKLLEKLTTAGLDIEEIKKESDPINSKDASGYQIVKFPCARDFVPIRFNSDIAEEILLDSNFEHYKFIKDFEAIWSSKLKIIECEISPISRYMGFSGFFIEKNQ